VGNGQNWNACRHLLRGANCCISSREDHIHGTAHQIGRMDLHSLRRQTETGCIDDEVSAFDEVEPPQFIEQRDIMRCIALGRQHDADAIDASGFLPLSDERPRGYRAAEQRDELAPFHRPMPPVLPTERIAQHCCAAGFQFDLCRLWVTTGHSAMSAQCPVCAKADTARRLMSTRPSSYLCRV